MESVNNNLSNIQNRVQNTLKLSIVSQQEYINYINLLYDAMSKSDNKEAVKWLNDNKELLNKTLDPLNNVFEMWPEFMQREDVNGKDTQI